MNRIRNIALVGLMLTMSLSANALGCDSLSVSVRAGYSVGASAPLGIPATIRSLESFNLTPNFLVGADIRFPLSSRWGLQAGAHFENKGMDVAVTTKGYHMAMVKGGEELEGVYTGRVEQQTKAWMLTFPLVATYDLSARWRLHGGPYLSLLTAKDFSGNVADGYLRKDTPTGQKIEMGHAMDERATYDFGEHVRHLQTGIDVGADYRLAKRLSLSADLSWGLSGLMHSSFKTVEQTLYPIYGTLSIAYRIR